MLESYPIVYFVKKKYNVAGTVSRVLMHVCNHWISWGSWEFSGTPLSPLGIKVVNLYP